ncbi:MAG: LLM class flavin-dependent oxidoreductase [Chloroflexi bacterium]|nr:LLM class flavin-dependent oxidoreductase [Chloroflexota bacterium]MCI0784926.1 LLM class flavin-dependent oxidoreductase [Chloroflexota bacterium]MCI0792330.1 LLM class flavin-dependent oxidoreductase [Chloroflexota bacterium]MCI0799475.1 LLM class flavin-dependent oxidoreductase [Chloroflexota bacterium]MCI0857338.1 LLM class flavin-dependent oxidoreductase [Chloroflexota bacterium]
MKFGLFYIVPWHEDTTQERALNEALEQIELADQLGIDEVWLGEHRFSRHGLLSGIWSFLGAVAGRTKNIRIGTAVIVLPLHNPILVAEEVAMLDIISGGRFNLGIGAGYQRQEFEGVGVDIDESRERFHEAVDVMIKAWTEEKLTYHGKFTNVDDLWVLPKPIQKPYPPLFQAVSTSPASVEFAASRQIQVIAGGPTDIMGQAPQVIQLWREKMEEHGYEHAHLDPPMSKSIYVAPTMEEAETDPIGLEDFSSRILRSIGSNGAPIGMPMDKDGNIAKGYEHWANRQNDRDRRDDLGHAGLPPLRGTPEVVIERLKQVQEAGINHVFGSFGFAGLPHEKVMRSIELFATQVMPHFQEAPTAAGR